MLTLYYCPQTRATSVRTLLEELGAPYELHVVDRQAGELQRPAFLAINPLGKVPAIVHDGAVVTEQSAIYPYLADAFPERGLAPPIGDKDRGPYLRWMAFYGSSFEPAMVDRAMKREPGQRAMSPYGDGDAVIEAVAARLEPGPFMLGERFSALDILWGGAIGWMLHFKIVPDRPVFTDYAARIAGRASTRKVAEEDAAMAAAQPT